MVRSWEVGPAVSARQNRTPVKGALSKQTRQNYTRKKIQGNDLEYQTCVRSSTALSSRGGNSLGQIERETPIPDPSSWSFSSLSVTLNPLLRPSRVPTSTATRRHSSTKSKSNPLPDLERITKSASESSPPSPPLSSEFRRCSTFATENLLAHSLSSSSKCPRSKGLQLWHPPTIISRHELLRNSAPLLFSADE